MTGRKVNTMNSLKLFAVSEEGHHNGRNVLGAYKTYKGAQEALREEINGIYSRYEFEEDAVAEVELSGFQIDGCLVYLGEDKSETPEGVSKIYFVRELHIGEISDRSYNNIIGVYAFKEDAEAHLRALIAEKKRREAPYLFCEKCPVHYHTHRDRRQRSQEELEEIAQKMCDHCPNADVCVENGEIDCPNHVEYPDDIDVWFYIDECDVK